MIVEGKTEKAFLLHLRRFLRAHLQGNMPNLDVYVYKGRIPTENKLRRIVQRLLDGPNASDHVIALTDVYTGSNPPEFPNAEASKDKMRQWVGHEPRFHPHVALHDFEAWLLPYWDTIKKLAGHQKGPPHGNPETINDHRPPSHLLKEIFEIGSCRDSYVKPRDADRILRDNDLHLAIAACSELKSLVNTIISLCGGTAIP